MWYGMRIAVCLVICMFLLSGTSRVQAAGEATMRLYQEALQDHSQGRYAEAISKLEGVTRQEPTFAPAFSDLGSCYAEQRHFDKAVECFKKALELTPNDVEIMNNLGGAYASMADFAGARTVFEKILTVNKGYEKAHFQLAILYLRENSTDEALGEARWLTEKDPDNLAYRTLLIHCYLQKGDKKKTRELCTQALAVDPANKEVQGILASLDRPELPPPGPPGEEPAPVAIHAEKKSPGTFIVIACSVAVVLMVLLSIPLRKWMTADPFGHSQRKPHELFADYEGRKDDPTGDTGESAPRDEGTRGEDI